MAPSLGDSIIATAHCVDDRVVVVVVLVRACCSSVTTLQRQRPRLTVMLRRIRHRR
jgi:hypothetical protein